MRIELNLSNYPNLQALIEQDRGEFVEYLKSVMELADEAVEKEYNTLAVQEFKLSYIEMLREVTEAFFDYQGILTNHHNAREAKTLAVIKHKNNPLASDNFYRIVDGELVTKEEFFGGKFKLKDWLQSMLYAGKYLSHADLVNYLTLGEFDLVERMKTDRIKELLKIQPALDYQKKHDLIVGKRLKGTGFFDCGHAEMKDVYCAVCRTRKAVKYGKYMVCMACRGAVIPNKEDN